MSRLIEIVEIMTRSNNVSATEGQCVIASVIIHSELEKPTTEFGSSMLKEAKDLAQPIIVKGIRLGEEDSIVDVNELIDEVEWTDHKQKVLNTLMAQRTRIDKGRLRRRGR